MSDTFHSHLIFATYHEKKNLIAALFPIYNTGLTNPEMHRDILLYLNYIILFRVYLNGMGSCLCWYKLPGWYKLV